MGNATSGSLTDKLTREMRMTADEARMILNVKKEDPAEKILQVRAAPYALFMRPAIHPLPPYLPVNAMSTPRAELRASLQGKHSPRSTCKTRVWATSTARALALPPVEGRARKGATRRRAQGRARGAEPFPPTTSPIRLVSNASPSFIAEDPSFRLAVVCSPRSAFAPAYIAYIVDLMHCTIHTFLLSPPPPPVHAQYGVMFNKLLHGLVCLRVYLSRLQRACI